MKGVEQKKRGAWRPYDIGQRVGHVTIEDVDIRGKYQTEVYYTGRLVCCGGLVERTHKTLAGQCQRGVRMCDDCRRKSEKDRHAPIPPTPIAAIRAAGMWWMSLGRMGFRQGAIDSDRP